MCVLPLDDLPINMFCQWRCAALVKPVREAVETYLASF